MSKRWLSGSSFGAVALTAFACVAAGSGNRSPGKPGAPVRIEQVGSPALRPGQAGDVEIRIIPSISVDVLRVVFRGDPGLEIQGSGARYVAPEAGVALTRRVGLRALSAGLYHLSVIVTTERGGASVGRVVSFTVRVGDISATQKARTRPVPPADSEGERIRSLRATETTPKN